jgi:hypothetical protein
MSFVRFLLALMVGSAPAAAGVAVHAQEAGPPVVPPTDSAAEQGENDRIVVRRGRPEDVSRAEVHRQARAITDADDQREVPLARFEDALCPGVMGLRTDAAMLMIDRIRDNAHQLGIRLSEDGCHPNMLVVFSPDSQATMQGMADQNAFVFQFLEPEDRREILAPAPVHVFRHVVPRTRDGMGMGQVRNLTAPPWSQQQMAHSLIYTTTRRDIASVTVVFDRDEVRGMSVVQLADYATMRGLAPTRPADGLAMDTILGLFDPDGPWPETLTDFDRAYLRALYDWIPNLPAAYKIGNVNDQLDRIAAEAGARDLPEAAQVRQSGDW